MALKRSRRGLQLRFRPRRDPSLQSRVMAVQSSRSPVKFRESRRDNFGTPFRESREFVSLGCRCGEASHSILYGGWWWHPPSPGRGESCGPKCPWLVPTPKGVPQSELTTWVVCLDADSSLIN
jgi:hypothetical protein